MLSNNILLQRCPTSSLENRKKVFLKLISILTTYTYNDELTPNNFAKQYIEYLNYNVELYGDNFTYKQSILCSEQIIFFIKDLFRLLNYDKKFIYEESSKKYLSKNKIILYCLSIKHKEFLYKHINLLNNMFFNLHIILYIIINNNKHKLYIFFKQLFNDHGVSWIEFFKNILYDIAPINYDKQWLLEPITTYDIQILLLYVFEITTILNRAKNAILEITVETN